MMREPFESVRDLPYQFHRVWQGRLLSDPRCPCRLPWLPTRSEMSSAVIRVVGPSLSGKTFRSLLQIESISSPSSTRLCECQRTFVEAQSCP